MHEESHELADTHHLSVEVFYDAHKIEIRRRTLCSVCKVLIERGIHPIHVEYPYEDMPTWVKLIATIFGPHADTDFRRALSEYHHDITNMRTHFVEPNNPDKPVCGRSRIIYRSTNPEITDCRSCMGTHVWDRAFQEERSRKGEL